MVGSQSVRVSPDGRFVFLFGSRDHPLGQPATSKTYAGQDTWPLVPPSNLKDAKDIWEGGYAAKARNEADSIAVLLGLTPYGFENHTPNYVALLWGKTESFLGSVGKTETPLHPPTYIHDAAVGNGETGLTIGVRREDGFFLYLAEPRQEQNVKIVPLQIPPKAVTSFIVSADGKYFVAVVKGDSKTAPDEIKFWNRQGVVVGSVEVAARIWKLVLSSDGKTMAVLTEDKRVLFYDNSALVK